jgi:hypothetical protein
VCSPEGSGVAGTWVSPDPRLIVIKLSVILWFVLAGGRPALMIIARSSTESDSPLPNPIRMGLREIKT